MTVSGTVLLYYGIGGNPMWVLLEQALRHRKCEGRRDKTGLVRTAAIFATEDHATTYMKGGTESEIQSTLRSKLGQYGKNQVRARVAADRLFKRKW
ncbi:MAG: hypothetical protein ABI856_14800, partial [Nitrospira sp.]